MGWNWSLSVLFGTLVIVTGPTVITPLVRRIRPNHNLQTLLEAEGVLIDPIGAITAIVALEFVIHPSEHSFFFSMFSALWRIGVGVVAGFVGGFAIALSLRPKKLIPEGIENIFALAAVLTLFHVSDLIQPDSGIAAVTVAGLVVGNTHKRVLRDLREFKEQLTVLLIAMLFVLLAADVRYEDMNNLGWSGLIATITLMLVIRPINIMVCTTGSGLNLRELTFLSWIAPRGIVAAAVASFFAVALNESGIGGGESLRALVFLVIAITVIVQGLSAGAVARLLRVRRVTNTGYAILGANELSRAVAGALKDRGEQVILLDSSVTACNEAEEEGFKVVFGNALEERTLQRARIEDMAGCIGLTPNEEVNLLFVTKAREQYKVPKRFAAIRQDKGHVTAEMVRNAGANVIFGAACDIDLWAIRLRRGIASVEQLLLNPIDNDQTQIPSTSIPAQFLVPMALYRDGKTYPVDDHTAFQRGDEVSFVVFLEKQDEARSWFDQNGWRPKTTNKEVNNRST
jgi:NhaP-type Na+/H+ or K+/H+ antiporter